MIFYGEKYEHKQSIWLGEINFDQWTYTHSSIELHICIMSKGNDVWIFYWCKLIQLDEIHSRWTK